MKTLDRWVKCEKENNLIKSVFAFFTLELLSLFVRRTSASCLMITHKDVATAGSNDRSAKRLNVLVTKSSIIMNCVNVFEIFTNTTATPCLMCQKHVLYRCKSVPPQKSLCFNSSPQLVTILFPLLYNEALDRTGCEELYFDWNEKAVFFTITFQWGTHFIRLVLSILWWIIDMCVSMHCRKHKSTFRLCLQRYQVHAKCEAQV